MPLAATKALRKASESGEPLPLPPAMARVVQAGGVFRRGHLVVIGAVPNAGKSSFAQWIAAETNVETLYFSADQDPFTTVTRLGATLTGSHIDEVARAITAGTGESYFAALATSNIQFVFDSTPSLDVIGLELDAYVDTWDEFPKLIVIDNLINIDIAGESAETDNFIMSELHGMARRTKACVVVLAHASENKTKENQPPARKDLLNQIGKFPELIFGVALDEATNDFHVAVTKTREGKADPYAKRPITLGSDFGRQQFTEHRPSTGWGYREEYE